MQASIPKQLLHPRLAASAPGQARAGRPQGLPRSILSGLVGFLLLLILPGSAGAQAQEIDILEISPDTGTLDLRGHLLFSVESIPIDVFLTYADPTGFVPLDSLEVPGEEGLIGCLYVNNPSDSYLSFVLAFGDPHFQAEVIQFREEETRRIQRTGLFLPYSALDRPWGRQGAVGVTFPPNALTPVFFKINQDYPGSWRRLPAALYPVDAWNTAVADRLTLQGFLQGFLATLLVFVLYRFARTRELLYLYLGAMAFLTATHFLAAEHLLPGRLFPEAPHWRRVLFLGLIPAFGSFGVLLVDRLFGGGRAFFTGYAIMSALIFLLGALLTIISPETIYPLMKWHLAGTAVVLLIATGWLAYRKRQPGHYFLLAGATAFSAGLAVYYWDAYRHLPALDGSLLLQLALLGALLGLGMGWRRARPPAAVVRAAQSPPAPLSPAPAPITPPPAASPETARDGLRAQPKLLLVVADDEGARRHLRATLGQDFHGLEAANGREGLHLAIHQIPDLIVADGAAPEMDGYDLYRALRADPRTSHIPVILRGPSEAGAEKLQGVESIALHFISETARAEELSDTVAQLLQQQEERQRRLRRGEEAVFTSLDRHFLLDLQELARSDDHADAAPETLSRALGMSRVQLHRKVKGLTGLSLRHFLEQSRQP